MPSRATLAERLSFKRVGATYILLAVIVGFSLDLGSTFFSVDTLKQILDNYSITALAGLALLIPFSAGVFDLSIVYTMSLSQVVVAYLTVHAGISPVVSVIVALAVGVLVGVVNGVVIVSLRIESLIGTLATGSLIQAATIWITNDTPINSPRLTTNSFASIAQKNIDGITIPVLYALILAVVIWHIQEHTVTGRRLYATGYNERAARMAGVRTARVRFLALVTSSTIAGFIGVVLVANTGAGDPDGGLPYLLPAFAVAFLGATQFKPGRLNVPGTMVAVALIGTGDTGLALAGAEPWASAAFTGVVLIAALAVTGRERRVARERGERPSTAAGDDGSGGAGAPRLGVGPAEARADS